jgi:hypothetical protein
VRVIELVPMLSEDRAGPSPCPPNGLALCVAIVVFQEPPFTGQLRRKMRARFTDLGGTAFADSPADLGKFIADETEKWAKVVRAANIRAD